MNLVQKPHNAITKIWLSCGCSAVHSNTKTGLNVFTEVIMSFIFGFQRLVYLNLPPPHQLYAVVPAG